MEEERKETMGKDNETPGLWLPSSCSAEREAPVSASEVESRGSNDDIPLLTDEIRERIEKQRQCLRAGNEELRKSLRASIEEREDCSTDLQIEPASLKDRIKAREAVECPWRAG